MDRRTKWEFVKTEQGKWKWVKRSPDGKQSESAELATLPACTADAAYHGYVAWKSEDERRRESKLGVMDPLKRKE